MKKFLLNIVYTIMYQFEQHRKDLPLWWYETRPFEDRPKWMQRVAVAQDVIAQLDANIYVPATGNYVKEFDTDGWVSQGDSVKANFDKIKRCVVCGIGACLMSAVKFKNKVKFRDLDRWGFYSNRPVKELLYDLFSAEQLYLIELAFEADNDVSFYSNVDKNKVDHDLWEAAYEFRMGLRSDNLDTVLRAIMNNIIRNKGTFKP